MGSDEVANRLLGYEKQTALAVARLDLVQAVIEYNVSQVRLTAAVGHLTPDALPEDRR